ncbi:MAG: phosphoenolpyruvate--protein phosphotransferase [Candidatus Omnitrophota bacterium]
MIKLKGIVASGGIAIGKAYRIGTDELFIAKKSISHEDISREIYRLEDALIETRKEIASIQKQISKELGFTEAKIFEAHLLVLEDRVLIEDVIQQIKKKKINVEYAFSQSIRKYIDALMKLKDPYLRERALDINDIGKRVLKKMLKKSTPSIDMIKEKVIIVAHDLSPADTAALPKSKIMAFVTDIGGSTAHTSIIARSLSIPAVVGIEVATQHIKGGEDIIVDGTQGLLFIHPTEKIIREYQRRLSQQDRDKKIIQISKVVKSKTLDKKEIVVSANIELPEELPLVGQFRAEGIGLYRTEFIFLGKSVLPSEEEQFKVYSNVAKKVKPYSVIIRTIDIGGDKFLSRPEVPYEFAPFLGWRAIRFCLARPDIFKVQLRAILRASFEGNIKVMFPMISGIEELRQAKELLFDCKKELIKEGRPFDKNIGVGIMVEVPSAALTADTLAKESDFFSIGTNDLIQYSIAVDRANEKVAYLYDPAHPAVLRLIKSVIEAAHDHNIWVGMCGEMAGELLFTYLLIGLGLDEFSMPPPRVPNIKDLIRKIRFADAKTITEEIINSATSKEVKDSLCSHLKETLKDDFDKFFSN